MWILDPSDACGGTALLFSLFAVEDNFNAVALFTKLLKLHFSSPPEH